MSMSNPISLYRFSGVYKITNSQTGDFYIGSSVNLGARKNRHINDLRRCTHYNQHLQNAFSLYGEKSFDFDYIILCDIDNLAKYEQLMCDILKPVYNKRKLVDSNRGRKLSEEQIKRMSGRLKGIPKPIGFSDKISKIKKGTSWSKNTAEKFSKSRTGMKINYPKNRKPYSDEYKRQSSIRTKMWWEKRKAAL